MNFTQSEQEVFLSQHDQRLEDSFKSALRTLKDTKIRVKIPKDKDKERELQAFISTFIEEAAILHKQFNTPAGKSFNRKGSPFPAMGMEGGTTRESIQATAEILLAPLLGVHEGRREETGFIEEAQKTARKLDTQVRMLLTSLELDHAKLATARS